MRTLEGKVVAKEIKVGIVAARLNAVSYTHLDVYKRQEREILHLRYLAASRLQALLHVQRLTLKMAAVHQLQVWSLSLIHI